MADVKPAAQRAAKPAAAKSGKTQPPTSPSVAIEPKRAPRRPAGGRRSREYKAEWRFVRTLSSLLTLTMIVVAALGIGALNLHDQYVGPGPLQTAKGFVVPKGEGRLEIAARLEKDGIISNRWTFAASQIVGPMLGLRKSAELKAGSYEFKKNASMREVVDILVEGKTATAKLTIPEGLTSQQIVERLRGNESLMGDITQIPAEGTLLPDTYFYNRGTTRQELLERMQVKQAELLAAVWEKRAPNLPFQTVQEAVIMASIVEKETGKSDERERVAAVFVNRLRKNMRLQSDPTIIYGIVGGQGSLGRPIMRSDIDQKTAYNTYQIDRLPPGPISNPGRQSIEATLNPAQTNEVYFVADGSGGHTFSETLKEHNAAVANWRRIEREAKAAKEAARAAQPVAAASLTPVAPVRLNGPKSAAPPPAPAVAAAAPQPAADAVPVMGSSDSVPAAAAAAVPTAPVTAGPNGAAPAAVTAAATAAAPVTASAQSADVPLPVRKPKK